ncbi:MAG: histidine phosphatase family protein [Chloroflexi bacterium]|nr:histidine phosphatase family protein [Chloroflexota bacterium]MYF81804.1 histidine phosphatase family protein [Chloroflexota bacterium]MYI03422.1 histidine phosphatase family protein [Chloroflexota bacterium]
MTNEASRQPVEQVQSLTWYLVRHGETDWNRARRIQGQSDIPLNARGRRQIAALGRRLNGTSFAAVYASDLSRTMQSARLLVDGSDPQVLATPELREFSYGEWEGLTIAEVEARDADRLSRRLSGRSEDFAGPGGENTFDVLERVRRFHAETAQRHAPDEAVLVVGHGGSLRALLVCLLDLPPEHFWRVRLDVAALSIVGTYPETGVLELWNDTGHLDDLDPTEEE